MSKNRENVTWRSARDGLWRTGFFAFEYVREDAPGFDDEWDVEYDKSRFCEVGPARNTADEAYEAASQYRSNPGGTWFADSPEDGKHYDRMAGMS